MLPAGSSATGKGAQGGLLVCIDAKGSKLRWSERDKEVSFDGKFSAEQAAEKYQQIIGKDKKLFTDTCSIQLPNKKILRRKITLPSSTEENLNNVVSYEMDRYTPFSKDDVYFDIKIQERDQKEQKITVALNVIKKSVLEEVVKFAEANGLSIQSTFATEAGNEQQVEHFDFIKDQQAGNTQKAASKLNKYLLIITLILAVIALILPIVKNYLQAEQLKDEIAQIQENVNQVRGLQAQYKSIKQDVDFITLQTSHSMKTLDLLNQLSKIVPDDTHLSRLVLEQGVVRMRGSSDAASRLISIIDSSEQFSDVKFVAPVTQNSKTGKESFTIEFQLQGDVHDDAVSK